MYDDWTNEDDSLYEQNHELTLFLDWCATMFDWNNYHPTKLDWEYLKDNWYPGQAPADAVVRIINS